TREGQLQVELAQLEYLLPRLGGRGVEMSQLGGGIGTRGPGETQLETDRRKIYRRIRHVKEQIENVRRIRAQQRQRRESVPIATIDLWPPKQRASLRDDASGVHVSAAKGIGLSRLLERIDAMLAEDPVGRVRLRVPQKEGKMLALLESRARIYSRQYRDGLVEMEAEAPESIVRRLREWVVK